MGVEDIRSVLVEFRGGVLFWRGLGWLGGMIRVLGLLV